MTSSPPPASAPAKRGCRLFMLGGVGCGVLGLIACAVLAALGWLFLTNSGRNVNPLAKASMWETTREWARLAPLPASATDIEIHTHGSSFTREFRGSFRLPKSDLEAWMRASPGLQDAETDGRTYEIKPGGGAMRAEVIIDETTGQVSFMTYWS